MKRRIITILIAFAVAVSFMPTFAHAASKVKMTAYDQVVKSGNTVYCAGEGNTIYKVKLKNGRVKSKKRLVKGDWAMGDYSYIQKMKKRGNYLYYVVGTEGTMWYFYRVNVKSGKKKELAVNATHYVIKKKKIYAEFYNEEGDTPWEYALLYKTMKLNGKGKKKSSVEPVMKVKKSNAKGYSMVYKISGDYSKAYLKTPKGRFYLGRTRMF